MSPRNETAKTIRRLRRSKGNHAILEGPHLVAEALRLGLRFDRVLMTPQFAESSAGAEILSALQRPPTMVAEPLLDALADADAPRGVLAVAGLQRLRLADLIPRQDDAWLYLDAIQDPGNLGALARVAEGLGATGLLLSDGCADSRHARALRASAGSLLRLPVVVGVAADRAKDALSRFSTTWVGLEAHAGAESLHGFAVERPFVLALGAEGPGLSEVTRRALDRTVTIPLSGRLESLNVAVAAALVLEQLR